MNVVAVGIDSVAIKRFKNWHLFDQRQLQKIFTKKEIEYCLQYAPKSAERFAVRFSAKEAFYKALSQYTKQVISLWRVMRSVHVERSANGSVDLTVNWSNLDVPSNFICTPLLSLTHTDENAMAVVMLKL